MSLKRIFFVITVNLQDHTSVGPQLSNLMKQLQTQQNIVRSDLLRTQEEIKTQHAKESLAVLYLELKSKYSNN